MFQFLFKWNNNWHITEDLYEFLNAHLALFGQEIALHKSCRVEWKACILYPVCFNVSHMVFDTVKEGGVNTPELLQSVYIS